MKSVSRSAAPTPFPFLQRGGFASSGHRIGFGGCSGRAKKRRRKKKLKGKTQILVDESIALPDPQTLLLDQERTRSAAAALPGKRRGNTPMHRSRWLKFNGVRFLFRLPVFLLTNTKLNVVMLSPTRRRCCSLYIENNFVTFYHRRCRMVNM